VAAAAAAAVARMLPDRWETDGWESPERDGQLQTMQSQLLDQSR